MSDDPRIEQLRRRVRSDPASIAFAALAEEYRKDGRYLEAIEICRVGLQRHPAYLSARVTLGRALIGTGDIEAARLELEAVLRVAPENLSAIRAMAEIYTQLRESDELRVEEAIQDQRDDAATVEAPHDETAPDASAAGAPAPLSLVEPPVEPVSDAGPPSHQTAIARLERFLEAIRRET